MKKYFVVAVSLLCFCGMAVAAHAQEAGKVAVNVPFEFIAGTRRLPAGTYTVSRTSSDTNSPLTISDRNHSALLLPAAFDDTPADNIRLSFEHVGDAYLLSEVATQIGTYTIRRPAFAGLAKLAKMKTHDNMKSGMTSASGSH